MKRRACQARANWKASVNQFGLGTFMSEDLDGNPRPYWNESAYFEFAYEEIEVVQRATYELHQMCLAVLTSVIERGDFARLGIQDDVAQAISSSWQRGTSTLYGRFDLRFDGINPPKLIEYNADTPQSLVEAGAAQLHWINECFPEALQWNRLQDALIDQWKLLVGENTVHLGFSRKDTSGEDAITVAYLADLATQAGADARLVTLETLDFDYHTRGMCTEKGELIRYLFKLYPWEDILTGENRKQFLDTFATTSWIEPVWKRALSNKALLVLLWEQFPNHPNLLPAYFDQHGMKEFAKKPILGRQGDSIELHVNGKTISTPGEYGNEGHIYQQAMTLPQFDDWYVVIGSWIVGDQPAGIGILESPTPIVDWRSSFVPHIIRA